MAFLPRCFGRGGIQYTVNEQLCCVRQGHKQSSLVSVSDLLVEFALIENIVAHQENLMGPFVCTRCPSWDQQVLATL